MATLTRGQAEAGSKADDNQVRTALEPILAKMEMRSDAVIREQPETSDGCSPEAIRLGQARIAELTQRELADIKPAQQKIREFAQVERNSMTDFKVIRQLYDRLEMDPFRGRARRW